MPIEHLCSCGVKLKVKDELAGKKIQCPKCSQTTVVPQPKIATEMIPVQCECGKAFRAKPSMAGQSFKCTACNRSVAIQVPGQAPLVDSDPFGPSPPNGTIGKLFDEQFPDLGIPTATHVAYQAPIQEPLRAKETTKKSPGISISFNQDGLQLATAILCILYGLGSILSLPAVLFLLNSNPGAIFSVGGMLLSVGTLVGAGICVAGIGLLLEQDWAVGLGQIAACFYFVLALIGFVVFLGSLSSLSEAASSYLLGNAIGSYITSLVTRSVAPGLLLYVTFRDN